MVALTAASFSAATGWGAERSISAGLGVGVISLFSRWRLHGGRALFASWLGTVGVQMRSLSPGWGPGGMLTGSASGKAALGRSWEGCWALSPVNR